MTIDKDKIVSYLIADYSLKPRGKYLREGRCPQCNKKSLFIDTENPFNLKCGRDNKCGYQTKTRDLYPECFKPLHVSNPPTHENPNATANAYLAQRGFDLFKIQGWYEQAQRNETKAVKEPKATETVRFYLDDDKQLSWDRYIQEIEMPDGPKKAQFAYGKKYGGKWWQPPANSDYAIKFEDKKRVWLAEGIFDAIALNLAGKPAVSLMSCNNVITSNDPDKPHDIREHFNKGVRWIIALDNDKAGKSYALRFYKYLNGRGERVQIAIAPDKQKKDWNDIYKENKGKIPQSVINDCVYEGSLLTATDARHKAFLMNEKTGRFQFPFDFGQMLWWAKVEPDKDGSIDPQNVRIEDISNCLPEFLYFEKDPDQFDAVPNYYLRVRRLGANQEWREAFKPSDISSAAAFKTRLYATGGGLMFTGTTQQMDSYMKYNWFKNPNPHEITAINYIGYSKEVKAWVFTNNAICQGQFLKTNQQDYFELPTGKHIKSSFKVAPIEISENHTPELWVDDYKKAFGNNGLLILAYWFGTFFAEQMRSEYKNWSFLELSGEPGTGKTMLLEFLWKLTGRADFEGVDFAKASHAGRWRTLSQLANLPTVLIEGDRGEASHARSFDWSELKPLFGGKGMRITGSMTNGNETQESPFRSAIVIAQNAMVDTEKAVMERIVHTHFDKSGHCASGFNAINRLNALSMEKINGFMPAATCLESEVMSSVKNLYGKYLKRLDLNDKLNNGRIKHTHAQILACAQTMSDLGVVPLTNDDLKGLFDHVVERAEARHLAIRNDHPQVEQFWDMFHFLQNVKVKGVGQGGVDHSKDNNKIAINFPQLERVCREFNQSLPANKTDLIKLLKNGDLYSFDGYKVVKSAIDNDTRVKCFVFNKPKGDRK